MKKLLSAFALFFMLCCTVLAATQEDADDAIAASEVNQTSAAVLWADCQQELELLENAIIEAQARLDTANVPEPDKTTAQNLINAASNHLSFGQTYEVLAGDHWNGGKSDLVEADVEYSEEDWDGVIFECNQANSEFSDCEDDAANGYIEGVDGYDDVSAAIDIISAYE